MWRERLADVIADALLALGVAQEVVDAEREHIREVRIGPTLDRSVVGSMNDFAFLADNRRDDVGGLDALDLGELSKRLAHVPCGPLYKSHTFPDAELHALLTSFGDGGQARPVTR